MKKLLALTAAVLCAVMLAVPSFALESGYDIDYSDSVDWKKFNGQGVVINVYNWGEYISVDDGEEGAFDTITEFEKLTGIRVNYSNFDTNESLYAKLKSGTSQYDVVIPSDYMIGRMINEGMLEQLDFSNIPNFENISERFRNPEYDPENLYSVPYMWGYVGLIYNTTMVDEDDDVETWDILWNEKYAGNMLMFSNSRDAFAIALARLGYSFNTTSEKELREAAESLAEQKLLIQAYVMDEIFDKMGGGEAAIAPYYVGDAIVMIDENPDLAFAIPREGMNVFVDAMVIPKGARNKEAAELFINFMCETLVGVKNCEYIGYSTPLDPVYEELDEETQSGLAYPPDEVLENGQVFTALPEVTTRLLDKLWTGVLSSGSSSPWVIPVFMGTCIAMSVVINITRRANRKKNFY
jgi:spermidine/putrescine transport system substrate-binding protein